jgi:tetratricopeptide (TPR) repeat protein
MLSEHQKNPDSIEANHAIAEYYLSRDMEEEAEPYLIKVLDLYGHRTPNSSQRGWTPPLSPFAPMPAHAGIPELDSATRESCPSKADHQPDGRIPTIYNQLGVVYFKQHQYTKAEHCFRKALQLDFKMAEAHFNLAFLYQMQGKFHQALPYYKEAANADPDDPEIYYLMGQCAQSAGMLQEAEAFLVESFRLAPKAEIAIDLSILYISEEKYPEAEDMLKWLLERADTEACSHTQHPASSIEYPASSIEYPASSIKYPVSSIYFSLGLVLAKQGKYMDAIRHLRSTVMMDDQNEQAFNYLGECCAAIGLGKEAESFFAKASKLDPQYLRPIMNLGKLHYERQDFYRAVAAMEHYLKVKGELRDAYGQPGTSSPQKFHDSETELVYELLERSYIQLGGREEAEHHDQ